MCRRVLEAAERTEVLGVPEGEHAAVLPDEPVAEAVGGGRHADDGGGQVDVLSASEVACVAEARHCAVRRDQVVREQRDPVSRRLVRGCGGHGRAGQETGDGGRNGDGERDSNGRNGACWSRWCARASPDSMPLPIGSLLARRRGVSCPAGRRILRCLGRLNPHLSHQAHHSHRAHSNRDRRPPTDRGATPLRERPGRWTDER